MTHPPDARAYVALAADRAARAGRSLVEHPGTLEAYVDFGRWVAECLHCGAGIAIHPEWDRAACLGVGCWRVYHSIAVPAEWTAIESVLLVRPMRAQSWLSSGIRSRRHGRGVVTLPSERVDDLIAENVEHGLPERDQKGRR